MLTLPLAVEGPNQRSEHWDSCCNGKAKGSPREERADNGKGNTGHSCCIGKAKGSLKEAEVWQWKWKVQATLGMVQPREALDSAASCLYPVL